MADRVVQADNVVFQQGVHCQCLMVGISGCPQGLLSWLLLPVSVAIKVVPSHFVSAMKFGLGRFLDLFPEGSSGLVGLCFTRCAPSMSQVSPGGSSLPPLSHLVLVQGSFLAGRPPGISWRLLSPITHYLHSRGLLACIMLQQGLWVASTANAVILSLPCIFCLYKHPLKEIGGVDHLASTGHSATLLLFSLRHLSPLPAS